MDSSESPRRSPEQEERQRPHKIFVTNLDVEVFILKERFLLLSWSNSCSKNFPDTVDLIL